MWKYSAVTTNGWMSHQATEESGGSFGFPEFRFNGLGCSLYTFLQSTQSGKNFNGIGQPGLYNSKPHLWTAASPVPGPQEGRGGGCEGNFELYLPQVRSRSENASTPLSTLQATTVILSGSSLLLGRGHRFPFPWKLRAQSNRDSTKSVKSVPRKSGTSKKRLPKGDLCHRYGCRDQHCYRNRWEGSDGGGMEHTEKGKTVEDSPSDKK